ncbi:hypothetical protein F0562_029564 [Nyssa sinensis]|uniref:Jacalin-type lectin domain-containing protein n=1 Tax=Nyssa sinensis TaxID=561372 RepID=A0A5J5B4E2_9ASTE|nr:hypothetical protein F0562_029564 [Nyssa sinensis]
MEKIANGSVGPFGGKGGAAWDDGIHSTVRQLIIYKGSVVDSIQIEYDDNGQSKWSPKHGESDAGERNVVKLEYPDEFLISISGYCTDDDSHRTVVRSLTIQSNRNQYGPFGTEDGKYFSTQSNSGKITGLHGRCGLCLDSIGAYFNPDLSISIGPFGGSGGNQWNDGVYTTIRQLIIHHGAVVESIQIEYDKNGRFHWSDKHGESEGGQRNLVKLDYPDEFLISLSGYCTEDSDSAVVRSLTIQSNKNIYGPYGIEEGKYFSTLTSGKIIGFHGRSGLYMDSIGAIFEPFSKPCQSIAVGPFGGHGGDEWDDGIYTTVRQIVIYTGLVINSIQIEYDKNGRSKWSEKHGEINGGVRHPVTLDYPGEFLISISGYCNTHSGSNVVQSLTFESNRRTYGHFGTKIGTYFKLPITGGKIVGFNGKSGYCLDSIGAHYEPILDPCSQPISIGPFGGHGGGQWDDGIYSTVRQLVIFSGSFINSIQIHYDRKGRSEWSQKHGESSELRTINTVKLNYPGEFLISISGYYGQVSGLVVVRSLTIESNKTTYGPFGVRDGNYFNIPPTSGKIIGFHGRSSGDYLHSIGAYIEPFFNS